MLILLKKQSNKHIVYKIIHPNKYYGMEILIIKVLKIIFENTKDIIVYLRISASIASK